MELENKDLGISEHGIFKGCLRIERSAKTEDVVSMEYLLKEVPLVFRP